MLFILFFILAVTNTIVFLGLSTLFSTLNLIVIFFSASILLFLIDMEFMAIVYTAVYLGAVMIFFIFVLMTINLRFEDSLDFVDEISSDVDFSFFVLTALSVLTQTVLFFEFKNFFDFRVLTTTYWYFLLSKPLFDKSKTVPDGRVFNEGLLKVVDNNFTSGLDNCTAIVSNIIEGRNLYLYDKIFIHTDTLAIAQNLFREMQINFFIITFILLFSMISAVGFATRAR